jgi:serine O-acetyltransferase
VFGVDIHPAAQMGSGILLDHAIGIVIGETATVGDNVTLYHGVTLGNTRNQKGDRHPKLQKCVLVGVGASILGNILIGEAAIVGAGSIVLIDVPAYCTVAGVPARIVKGPVQCEQQQEETPLRAA